MNSQAFTPEEVKKGFHQKLLNTLLEYNTLSETHYHEIHITTDSYCLIIEWETVPYDHDYGGTFKYVDEDHVVMQSYRFPDGHHEFLFDEDVEEALNDWLKDHPNWEKSEYGIWHEVIPTEEK